MIEAFAPDRADQPLNVSVLPRRPGRGRAIADAQPAQTPLHDRAIGCVVVSHQECGCFLPREGLDDLPRYPFVGGVGRDGIVDEPSPAMVQNDQAIKQPEVDRRHDQQISPSNAVGMIAQEGCPTLRRRSSALDHVLRHGGLGDLDAQA